MPRDLLKRSGETIVLGVIFFRELFVSSYVVAQAAFAREPRTNSAIIAVPIELRTDLGIAVLANCITLTPGTCSLHVSEDRKILYVHALDADDPSDIVAGINAAFQDRIRRIEA